LNVSGGVKVRSCWSAESEVVVVVVVEIELEGGANAKVDGRAKRMARVLIDVFIAVFLFVDCCFDTASVRL
jgi:hypothetical protein